MGECMQKNVDLTIIIVNYNTFDQIKACIKALLKGSYGDYTYEVYIVDNNSNDKSPEYISTLEKTHTHIKKIFNHKNVGFAKANNMAIKKAKGRYILLLNSDTEVERSTIKHMIHFMDERQDIAVSTCKLVLENGSIDPACHRGFPTPWTALTYLTKLERLFPKSRVFSGYHQWYKDLDTIHDVDCISGAFFFIRKDVIDTVGYLDEDFFMYAEDIDWSYRIKKHGYRIVYNPNCSVLHKKKKSGRDHKDRDMRIRTQIHFHTYNKLFYTKHYEEKYGPFVSFFVHFFYRIKIHALEKKLL